MSVRTPLELGRHEASVGVLGAVIAALVGPGLGVTLSWFAGRYVLSTDPLSRLVIGTAIYGVALVAVGVGYLALIGRLDRLSLGRFDASNGRLIVAGIVVLVGAWTVAVVVIHVLDVPFAGNATTSLAEHGRDLSLLVFAAMSPLVIAPAEELLFRGAVQGSLYDLVSRPAAVVLASVTFALIHVPTLRVATTDPIAVAVSMVAVFGLSLVFGWFHARTGDLLVPIAVHGGYNAVVYCLLYLGGI